MTFPLDNLNRTSDATLLAPLGQTRHDTSDATFRSHLNDTPAEEPSAAAAEDDPVVAPQEPVDDSRAESSNSNADHEAPQSDSTNEEAADQDDVEPEPDSESEIDTDDINIAAIPFKLEHTPDNQTPSILGSEHSQDVVTTQPEKRAESEQRQLPVTTANPVAAADIELAEVTDGAAEPEDEQILRKHPIDAVITPKNPDEAPEEIFHKHSSNSAVSTQAETAPEVESEVKTSDKNAGRVDLARIQQVIAEPATTSVHSERENATETKSEGANHVQPAPDHAGQPSSAALEQPPQSTANRFAEHLVGRAQSASDPQQTEVGVDQNRFIQRVVRAFRTIDNQNGEVRLRLSPPELGSLRLDVKLQNGALTARIESETTTARTLLLENLPVLRERLAEQGIRVENFEVDVPDRQPGNLSDRSADQQNSDNRPAAQSTSQDSEPPAAEHAENSGASTPTDNRQINIVV